MIRLKVFISYSGKDKHFAGNIKDCFEQCVGFDVFLAHDDLRVSDQFPREIIKRLSDSDFIVPLISKNFLSSGWANQEIGIALEKRKKIVPISIDRSDPEGFIRDYHAFKCSSWNNNEYLNVVTQIYSLPLKHPNYIQFKQKVLESIVYALTKSNHFKITSIIIGILDQINKLARFNDEQVGKIIIAATTNPQVYNADYLFPNLVKFLRKNYGIVIDKPS